MFGDHSLSDPLDELEPAIRGLRESGSEDREAWLGLARLLAENEQYGLLIALGERSLTPPDAGDDEVEADRLGALPCDGTPSSKSQNQDRRDFADRDGSLDGEAAWDGEPVDEPARRDTIHPENAPVEDLSGDHDSETPSPVRDQRGIAGLVESMRHWRTFCKGHRLVAGEAATVHTLRQLLEGQRVRQAGLFLADVAPDVVEAIARDPEGAVADPGASRPAASGHGPGSAELLRRVLALSRRELEAGNMLETPLPAQLARRPERLALRAALEASIRHDPPDADAIEGQVRALLDQAEIVQTALEDLPLAVAVEQLRHVRDDLAWHLAHVVTASTPARRRLRKKLRQIDASWIERQTQLRLERRFGRQGVSAMQHAVVILVLALTVLTGVELTVGLPAGTEAWFALVDSLICLGLLTEFGVRWAHASWSGRYFLRHALTDVVPSLPVGALIVLTSAPETGVLGALRIGQFLRMAQFGRLARYVWILRPLLWTIRAVALSMRWLDRIVARLGPLLNQNVILYPTREEVEAARHYFPDSDRHHRRRLRAMQTAWRRLVLEAPPSLRDDLAVVRAEGLAEPLGRAGRQIAEPLPGEGPLSTRDIPAAVLLERLVSVTAEDMETTLERDLTHQFASVVRVLSRPPLVWLPLLRSLPAGATSTMTDAEATAVGCRRLAAELRKFHHAAFVLADLYGAFSPVEVLTRLGGMLIKSSFRPVYQLIVFGGLYLLIVGALRLTGMTALESASQWASRSFSSTLLIVGIVCGGIVVLGWWVRSTSRSATEFYERFAQAQFLSLTETIRSRNLARDCCWLYERVLMAESLIRRHRSRTGGSGSPIAVGSEPSSLGARLRLDQQRTVSDDLRRALVEGQIPTGGPFGQSYERVVLLYRDWIDGAMFCDDDARAASQLVGNPALTHLIALSRRISPGERRRLARLDLLRQKTILFGPYFWFRLLTQATTHAVAKRLVEYNLHAIPTAELDHSDAASRQRYRAWLTGADRTTDRKTARTAQDLRRFTTTNFHALHFLDDDPERDAEVGRRFGDALLAKLRRDRGEMTRRLYGTLPLHRQPRDTRVINLYRLYQDHFAHGRILVLPIYLTVAVVRLLAWVAVWLVRAIHEARSPHGRLDISTRSEADLLAAYRKIDRVRGPLTYATILLRTRLDPEYLGVALPLMKAGTLGAATVQQDFDDLAPIPATLDEIERERDRAAADMRRLEGLIRGGLLDRLTDRLGLPTGSFGTPQHLRAAAIIYFGDLDGVRRLLSAETILREVMTRDIGADVGGSWTSAPWLWTAFRSYWRLHGSGHRRDRRALWRAVVSNRWDAAACLRVWSEHERSGPAEGERRLAELLRHPSRITEQLVTLRTVQTLALLDVLNYREQVRRLGQYDEPLDEDEDRADPAWTTDQALAPDGLDHRASVPSEQATASTGGTAPPTYAGPT